MAARVVRRTELVEQVGALVRGNGSGRDDGALDPLVRRHPLDPRLPRLQCLRHVAKGGGRHNEPHRMAEAPSRHRQSDAGVARGGFDNLLSGSESAVSAGLRQHVADDAVLDGAGRILALQLREQPHVGLRTAVLQLHHRRAADEAENVFAHKISVSPG